MRVSEFVQVDQPSNQVLTGKALETKRLLEKSGFFQALAEGQRIGESTAQTLEKIAKKQPETHKNGTPPRQPKADVLLDAIINEWLESGERLTEKDARIEALEEEITRLQARISELERSVK